MAFAHILPWYSLYTLAVNAAWLTAVILRHAAAFATAFAAASADVAAVLRAEEQRKILRFEAVVVDGDDDDDSVSGDGTVNSSAPIADHLTSGARRVSIKTTVATHIHRTIRRQIILKYISRGIANTSMAFDPSP